MKSIMKLIITVIVVAVMGFTVGYLLMNGAKKNNNEPNQIEIEENIINEKSGELVQFTSPNSGDKIDNDESLSGESNNKISKEEKIKRIEEQVTLISSGDNKNFRDNLTIDMVSDSAKDFMKYFKLNALGVTVNIKPGFVEIMPDTDFIENMVYYYDENGDLILYEGVSTTVEGSCKYYFEKGSGISVVANYEDGVEHKEEYMGSVLNRAKLIYDKYLDQ